MKNVIFGWIIIIACVVGGCRYGQYRSDLQAKEKLQKEVINWNTKQIHSIGVASATDSHNTELLIQILNKLEELQKEPNNE